MVRFMVQAMRSSFSWQSCNLNGAIFGQTGGHIMQRVPTLAAGSKFCLTSPDMALRARSSSGQHLPAFPRR
jgi:hypothetical protein